MPILTVTLDSGENVPLKDAEWVFYAACGCPIGCMVAQTSLHAAYDEETAFWEHYNWGTRRETEKAIRDARKAGVTAELMTFKRWHEEISPKMARTYRCPHKAGGDNA